MIAGPPGRLGNHAREPQRPQVQLVDEHVDHPDRVLLRHVVIQELGKQDALTAILTLDEALHRRPRSSVVEIITQPAFSHSLDPERTWEPLFDHLVGARGGSLSLTASSLFQSGSGDSWSVRGTPAAQVAGVTWTEVERGSR